LVGHGVDRGGELLAHASAEVTGVLDDDQAARRPCLVQLPRSVERAGDVVAAVNQRGGICPILAMLASTSLPARKQPCPQ
jgi:hypothetical protein